MFDELLQPFKAIATKYPHADDDQSITVRGGDI